MSGETGNFVVKVNVKKNMEEGPIMASAALLKAWVRHIRSQIRQMGLSRLL
jgi:hypothetical protein